MKTNFQKDELTQALDIFSQFAMTVMTGSIIFSRGTIICQLLAQSVASINLSQITLPALKTLITKYTEHKSVSGHILSAQMSRPIIRKSDDKQSNTEDKNSTKKLKPKQQ